MGDNAFALLFVKSSPHGGKNYGALRWILTIAEAAEKLVRWRLKMSRFEFDVFNCGGKVANGRHNIVPQDWRCG